MSSVVSGVLSRQVLPACGALCYFCPGLRTRSRQPVKRYKKMISQIFPKTQDGEANERMIGKLCEYAARNPLRIPKIANTLEQRFYKELRNGNFNFVKIVMCIYRKLLLSCREQMPLYASSLLSIMDTLLDQTGQDEMRVIGCQTLFVFVNNQKDGSFLFSLESFIPKLSQLAQEVGEDERGFRLRAAGLQALSSMIWFMGEHSHMLEDFDNVVMVVLENYSSFNQDKGNGSDEQVSENRWVQEVTKDEGHAAPSPELITRVPSWRGIINTQGELNIAKEDAESPGFWSRVCLNNMAKLGQEATTIRRVMESLFRYFDNENMWSPKHGLAGPVLKDMQAVMEHYGHGTHFLLSILVKHLDHKNVVKKPEMQLDIVRVITSLAEHAKVESSVALLGAVGDVLRHLRRSIHLSLDDTKLGSDSVKRNRLFQELIDECLVQLVNKVGDAGPVLDIMAVILENLSSIALIARATITAVYRVAQIIAFLPNVSYQNKAFPEALFHHLLIAMVHQDNEARIGAHRIFSVVLVPSSVAPRQSYAGPVSGKAAQIPRSLSRTVSVFSSSAALFEKLRNERLGSKNNALSEGQTTNNNSGVINRLKSSYNRTYSMKSGSVSSEEDLLSNLNKEVEGSSLRLSSRQITLLLSSIWAQSICHENTPENYEAIAHTYSLVLLYARAKGKLFLSVQIGISLNTKRHLSKLAESSSLEALVRSFQLAFSLRGISLAGGQLQPSRRRSLLTMSTSMIVFSAKAYNIPSLVSSAKESLNNMTDPFLCLVGGRKLKAVRENSTVPFGSQEDDISCSKFLSEITRTENRTRESFVEEILKSLEKTKDDELHVVKKQLLSEFLPDEDCPLGARTFEPSSYIDEFDSPTSTSHELSAFSSISDVGYLPDKQHNQELLMMENRNLLSATQLLESVIETAQQVGSFSVSDSPEIAYKELANHCEALSVGKHEKMSHLMVTPSPRGKKPFDVASPPKAIGNAFNDHLAISEPNSPISPVNAIPMTCGAEMQHFKLPASSPYDNFLKAAGC